MTLRVVRTCSLCKAKAVFTQHGKGYCGSTTEFGLMNQFGYCLTNNQESPELIKYRSKK
jgi:hypothetical protein